MPEQIIQRDRPELGFASVGDYLNANRGIIDRDYSQARTDAASVLGVNAATLPGTSVPPPPGSTQVEGLSSYLDQTSKAHELGRTFSDPGALASSARYGRDLTGRGPGTFSAALQFAKYGGDYQKLGDYLNKFTAQAPAAPGPSQPEQPQQPAPPPEDPRDIPRGPPGEPGERPRLPGERPPTGGGGTGGRTPTEPEDPNDPNRERR